MSWLAVLQPFCHLDPLWGWGSQTLALKPTSHLARPLLAAIAARASVKYVRSFTFEFQVGGELAAGVQEFRLAKRHSKVSPNGFEFSGIPI
jgi:hypothetical protein